MKRTLAIVTLLCSAAAFADDTVYAQSWSVVGARTAGLNQNQLEAGAGWPGAHFQFSRGLLSNFDLGGRFGVNYGVQGISNDGRYPISAGITLQAALKVKFFEQDRVSLGVTFMPGPVFWFPPYFPTQVGFTLPVELKLGIAASSAINVGLGLGVPFWIHFGAGNGAVIPVLVGGGAEYFLRSDLALFFDLRMGPTIYGNGRPAAFTLDAKVGIGWHL